MKPNEQEIERLLRRAPKPSPPAGLKDELLAGVSLTGANASSRAASRSSDSGGWLRRWWPVLMPAAASLVCCVVLAFQRMEIRELRESIAALLQKQDEAEMTAVISSSTNDFAKTQAESAAKELEEINRLKNRATQLYAEIVALEQVKKGNEELRAKLNAPPTLNQEELGTDAEAEAKAKSVKCVNNLKQFGLCVRLWMQENNEVSPPDILSMSNMLNTPKILVCQADTNRVAAKSWEVFTEANCSYEYLTPSVSNPDRDEPMRVQTRCPLHGHVGLCDGSVQIDVAKKYPERLKVRGGKLYYEPQ